MPAWLSDPPVAEREPVVPVELPSWVGSTTRGADDVAAGFEEAVDPVLPGDGTIAAALSALGGDDEEPIELGGPPVLDLDGADLPDLDEASREAFEALRRLEDDRGTPAAAESDAGYGVASKRAFESLRHGDGDDLGDWEAFAGSAEPTPVPEEKRERRAGREREAAAIPEETRERRPGREREAAPTPPPGEQEAFDDWAGSDEPVRERRGIWPFRRRQRHQVEPAEEAVDWSDPGAPVPDGWFPEVDEDAVVPPTPDLPEVEWPAPVTESPIVADVTPTQELPSVPRLRSVRPRTEPEPPREDTLFSPSPSSEPPDGPQVRYRSGAPDLPMVAPYSPVADESLPDLSDVPVVGVGREEIEFEEEYAGPGAPPVASSPPRRSAYDDEELADLRGPFSLAFDDGTLEPLPEDPRREVAERPRRGRPPAVDPEATVEMTDPGLGFPEEVYGGAVTVEHRGLAEEIYRLGGEDTEWQAMAAAMPGVETGVVGFEDVADLSTGEEYRERPATRSDLGARIGTGFLLLVFLLGSMFVGGAALAVFIGAMAMLGIWEFYGTLRRLEFRPLGVLGYLGAAGMLVGAWFHGPIAIPIAAVATVIVVFFVYAFSPLREDALANGGLTVLGLTWVAGTVAFAFPILRHEADFRVLVMAIVAGTVAMDVGAYAFGRAWGRRALAPVVSPNKSVEGLVGGTLAAVGATVAFGALGTEPFDVTTGLLLGAVVAVMAPLGDLAESMVKRSLGVKDMGTILPGHGGVLDRIDGFLFVLPAAWVLYQVVGFLG